MAAELTRVGLKNGDRWAHSDEMRLGLHGQVRRVWAPRGVKVRQRRQIVYRWAHLAIAVDGIRGELGWKWLPNMRKEAMAEVVKARQGKGFTVIVWDGASAHRAKKVRAVGLPLIGLPPSAPELNPAERGIEAIRDRIEGRVYESIDAKREAAEAVLREFAADPARVSRLAGWAWIREAERQRAPII